MKADFLTKGKSGKLIVFYNGWGCGQSMVEHLKGDYDVLMLSQYHVAGKVPCLAAYGEINVVAWSMGVWYAATDGYLNGLDIKNKIAVNGTGSPVSDTEGIPVAVFEGTLNRLTPESLEKFSRRSCGTRENFDFVNKAPFRTFENIAEELRWWHENYKPAHTAWSRAIVSENDRIMPPKNQINYWLGRNMEAKTINAAHYNFEKFTDWEQILNY